MVANHEYNSISGFTISYGMRYPVLFPDQWFKISIKKVSQPQLTKRNILRKIATIFDPLGFVSPFVVVAKILLQELWARGYGWDDEIADEIALRIAKWFDQLKQLNTVKIPRCLRAIEPVVSTKVITFTDASVCGVRCTFVMNTKAMK